MNPVGLEALFSFAFVVCLEGAGWHVVQHRTSLISTTESSLSTRRRLRSEREHGEVEKG